MNKDLMKKLDALLVDIKKLHVKIDVAVKAGER